MKNLRRDVHDHQVDQPHSTIVSSGASQQHAHTYIYIVGGRRSAKRPRRPSASESPPPLPHPQTRAKTHQPSISIRSCSTRKKKKCSDQVGMTVNNERPRFHAKQDARRPDFLVIHSPAGSYTDWKKDTHWPNASCAATSTGVGRGESVVTEASHVLCVWWSATG